MNIAGLNFAGGHISKKRHRSTTRSASTLNVIDDSQPRGTLTETSQPHKSRHCVPSINSRCPPPPPPLPLSSAAVPSGNGRFNDSATADVILRLRLEPAPFTESDPSSSDPSSTAAAADTVEQADVQIFLHSDALCRSRYFSALLSDRWIRREGDGGGGGVNGNDHPHHYEYPRKMQRLNFTVAASNGSIDTHLKVLQLLYTDDFSRAIYCASTALQILPVALELLFEDCVRACVQFLEAVPWSEEEEKKILSVVPLLSEEESKELLARVVPANCQVNEDMLHGLILSAIQSYPNLPYVKAFVSKLLKDFSSRESAKRVLERAFESSLKVVKESVEEYSSPDLRGHHDETEAIQRLNLHTAMTNGRHVLWLVERMIELRVADTAVTVWSEQGSFTSDLQRAFQDDGLQSMAPGLPVMLLRCTTRLANALVAGSILAPRQVRMKFVKDWLPVLNVSRDRSAPIMMVTHKELYLELEQAMLKIISTLPLSDAEGLLQQCLNFSTRNVEDCPHLVKAFNTWFRRATRVPQADPS